jgi:enediyne biosynthesis protein E4
LNCTWAGVPVNCGPRGLPYSHHSLYRNNGRGVFTEVSKEAGIASVPPGYGMTVVAADFDNDDWPDIYVACDTSPSLLFRNKHDGTFEEVGLPNGCSVSDDGLEQAGMGVGVGDVNLDGNLDIFKTHFMDDTNVLYVNDGKGYFENETIPAGLGVETRYVNWGAGIVDLDNDGNPDLFYVTGNVYPEVERKRPQYQLKTPRVIFRNLGTGKFEELVDQGSPGISKAHCSRGCAFGDFDNDGDVDILIVNLNEPPSLLRNDLRGNNHWLKLKLVGTKSNRSAIGTRVTCHYGGKRQAQELVAQSSFYSSNDPRLHFGLGSAVTVDLEIRWPSRTKQMLKNVKADQILTVREP